MINAFNEPDSSLSPVSQLRDMFSVIKLVNDGVTASAYGSDLRINTSTGVLYGLGIGYITNKLNPNSLTVGGQSPASFQYRTSTGGTAANVTLIEPGFYDLNGVRTAISGVRATNQRIYLLQNGQIRIQYGQTQYNQLAAAIAALQNEVFVTFPNFRDNGILIGILSVLSTCADLSDTSKAQFFSVSKFGELIGAAGGTSTTTLQQAYNNSSTPEITTNLTLGPLSVKNGAGTADNVTNVFEGVNSGGTTTSYVRADGAIYGSTISGVTISATTYQNLPVSGLTAGNNINVSASSGNFTISVTGITGNYLPISGGTVSGATNFTNGLTANTISGGTYIGDGSQLNVANPSTGTTITFTAGTIYNTPTSAATGDISADTTNAKIGIVQKIYHNHSVAPTFNPSGWVKLGIGTYTTSTLNVIYAEWVSGTRVEYWIVNGS